MTNLIAVISTLLLTNVVEVDSFDKRWEIKIQEKQTIATVEWRGKKESVVLERSWKVLPELKEVFRTNGSILVVTNYTPRSWYWEPGIVVTNWMATNHWKIMSNTYEDAVYAIPLRIE